MKEKDENSSFDNKQSNNDENLFLKRHEEKMNSMIDNSYSVIKKIKEMGKEISSDLKSQNKLLGDIGLSLSRTTSQLKKNTSKIDEILSRTSTCSLIMLSIAQIIAIVLLILL